jgi:Mce-associated membrane protein
LVFNRTTTKDVFDTIVENESEADIGMPEDNEAVQDPDPTDGVAVEEDSEATVDEPTQPTIGKWLRRVLAATAVVLFVAAVALAGFFWWQLKQERDVDAAGREALAVAQNYAVILTSVDNTKIDENFAQVLDGATGEFKDMYSQSAAQLRQLLIDNKAVSHGTVVDAGIKSATKDKVELLIYVDQSISNTVNPQPRIDRSRVTITMERIDNRWLASKVDIK